jgi:hypothetical protein
MTNDYALTEGDDGVVVLHRADCSHARMLAALGYPVATLFGCERPMPSDIQRHWCLEEPWRARSAG